MGVTWLELHSGDFKGMEPFMPAYVVEDYLLVMEAEGNAQRERERQAKREARRK